MQSEIKRPFWERLLGPLTPSCQVGVHVEAGEVVSSAVVSTLLGPRSRGELSRATSGRRTANVLAELLPLIQSKVGRLQHIVVGVPARDVYYEMRRLTPGTTAKQLKAQATVPGIHPDDTRSRLAVHLARSLDPTTGRVLHCIAAARDQVVEDLESLVGHEVPAQVHFEPVPQAALRYSIHHNPPQGNAVTVRILTGPNYCAGYLLEGSLPLLWMVAPSHAASYRPEAVLRIVATLRHHARAYLELNVGTLSVEGGDSTLVDDLAHRSGLRVQRLPGQEIDGRAIAMGLALGACGVRPAALHLHRAGRERRRTEKGHIPWREMAAAVVALVILVVAMQVQAERQIQAAKDRLAQAGIKAKPTQATLKDLEAESAELSQMLNKWDEFQDRPVSWVRALSSLAQALPDQVRLVKIEGRSPAFRRSSQPVDPVLIVVAPEKRLTMGVMLADPYLKVVFPRVEVSMSAASEGAPGVLYTLVASGQATDAASDAPSAEAGSPAP